MSPFAKLIFTHKLGCWTQGALRQIPHPPPDLPLAAGPEGPLARREGGGT